MNCSIGFTTRKGICLDLDNVIKKKAEKLAELYLKKYDLEGYLLIRSSPKHYHLVFNRYLSWRTTIQIIFSTIKCVEWGIWQARKGELTLRVSAKNGRIRNNPEIVKCVGKTDKLIKDYLEVYYLFNQNIGDPMIPIPTIS